MDDCEGAFFFGWLGWKSTVGLLKNSLVLFEGKAQLGFAPGKGGRKGARLVHTSSFSGDTHRVSRVWARRPSAGRGEGRRVQRGVDGGTGAGSPHDPSLALAERAATTTPRKRHVNWLALCRQMATERFAFAKPFAQVTQRLPLTRFAGAPLCGGEPRRTRSQRAATCGGEPRIGARRGGQLRRSTSPIPLLPSHLK